MANVKLSSRIGFDQFWGDIGTDRDITFDRKGFVIKTLNDPHGLGDVVVRTKSRRGVETITKVVIEDESGTGIVTIKKPEISAAYFLNVLANWPELAIRSLLNGDDRVTGGNQTESLESGAGDDVVSGGGGDDFVVAWSGNNDYDGGDGTFDFLTWRNASRQPDFVTNPVFIDVALGTATNPFGGTDTFRNFEGYELSTLDDVAFGSVGNDVFRPFLGDDTIDGREGFDTIDFRRDERLGGTGGVEVDLGAGFAIDPFGTRDTLIGIERAFGTARDDVLVGDRGGNGLLGEAGDDLLEGGLGADTISPGEGADTIVYRTPDEGADIIFGFSVQDDTIAIDTDGFSGLRAGRLRGSQFVDDANPVGSGRLAQFLYDTDDGTLAFDPDGGGNRDAIVLAVLDGAPSLAAADFDLF